jgi:hypothetical protein
LYSLSVDLAIVGFVHIFTVIFVVIHNKPADKLCYKKKKELDLPDMLSMYVYCFLFVIAVVISITVDHIIGPKMQQLAWHTWNKRTYYTE